MNLKLIIACILFATSFNTAESQPVVRMLFFNLKYEVDSPEAKTFIEGTGVLKDIPAVTEFEVFKVRSKQFNYDYAIRIVIKYFPILLVLLPVFTEYLMKIVLKILLFIKIVLILVA
jgi:hypothetical protein